MWPFFVVFFMIKRISVKYAQLVKLRKKKRCKIIMHSLSSDEQQFIRTPLAGPTVGSAAAVPCHCWKGSGVTGDVSYVRVERSGMGGKG